MLTSKLNRFPVKLELPSGADRFCPTFFVILCTFANELSNVRARKGIKVPDVSRHSGRWGGGGNPGHMWGNQGLCGNSATNSNDAPTRGENVGTLLLARRKELGSNLCFCSIEEKIPGKNENVCVKIHRLLFIFGVCMK